MQRVGFIKETQQLNFSRIKVQAAILPKERPTKEPHVNTPAHLSSIIDDL